MHGILGVNPCWLSANRLCIMCSVNASRMILFINFPITDVKLIGRWFSTTFLPPFLCMGVMFAIFYSCSNLPSSTDFQDISYSGLAMAVAVSFRQRCYIESGPPDLHPFKCRSFSLTLASNLNILEGWTIEFVINFWQVVQVSQLWKHELKKLLKSWAFTWSFPPWFPW